MTATLALLAMRPPVDLSPAVRERLEAADERNADRHITLLSAAEAAGAELTAWEHQAASHVSTCRACRERQKCRVLNTLRSEIQQAERTFAAACKRLAGGR